MTSAYSVMQDAQKYITGELPPPPIAQTLGFTLTSVQPGQARIEFEAQPRHANPMGALHGGVLCDIADAAMGVAYGSTLAPGETFATMELKINFLRPVWTGLLAAEGRVVSRGRSTGLVECDITDARGRLVARASSTCTTLTGEQAAGR
jgi:uncharacterized protein (TIGR00369 family)